MLSEIITVLNTTHFLLLCQFYRVKIIKFTHLEHPDLADHGLRVYLTHVVARVIPLYVPDVQFPGVDPVV